MYFGHGQAITQYTTDAAALGFCHRGPRSSSCSRPPASEPNAQLATHRSAPGCEATGCIALLCRLRSRTDMAHGRRIRIIGYFLLLATRRAIGSSSAIHGCSPLTLSGGSSTPSVTGTRTPDPSESNGRAPEQAGKIRAVGHQHPSSRNLRSPAAGSQSPGHLARVS
jgi:hypothetical protein